MTSGADPAAAADGGKGTQPPPSTPQEAAEKTGEDALLTRQAAEERASKLPKGFALQRVPLGKSSADPVLQPDAEPRQPASAEKEPAGGPGGDTTHLDTTNVAAAAAAAARTAAENKVRNLAKMQRREARATVVAKDKRMLLSQQLIQLTRTVNKLAKSVQYSLADARARNLPFGVSRKAVQGLTVELEKQRLEVAHTRRLQEIVSKQCVTTVRNTMAHKWAWPFNTPVDPAQLGLHDYFKVISHPMDLGTVRKRAEAGSHYREPEDVAVDVRLALNNAMTYNPPGSDVHVMAKTLLERFEEKWRTTVWPKLADEEALVRADAEKSRRRLEEAAKAREVEVVDKRLREQQRALEEAERQLVELKQQALEACTPMEPMKKRRLGEALGRLPTDKLGGAVAIVAQRSPGLVAAAGEEVEMELDLDTQDPLTLRQLEHYVRCATSNAANAH